MLFFFLVDFYIEVLLVKVVLHMHFVDRPV